MTLVEMTSRLRGVRNRSNDVEDQLSDIEHAFDDIAGALDVSASLVVVLSRFYVCQNLLFVPVKPNKYSDGLVEYKIRIEY